MSDYYAHTKNWYDILEGEGENAVIRLKESPYEKVTYRYAAREVMAMTDDGHTPIEFQLDFIKVPSHVNIADMLSSEQFNTTVGNILIGILEERRTVRIFPIMGDHGSPLDDAV